MTRTPIEEIDVLLADLDGVVYRGPSSVPYAVESINALGSGIRVGYLTNNASRSDVTVAAHLTELGLHVGPDDVVTSPQAAMSLLEDLVPAGSTILVIGGEGLTVELARRGFVATRSAEDSPAAVVQGFDPSVGWVHLAEAAFLLNGPGGADIPWVATNTDWTIPQARGTAPGNGTLVSAVHTAVGRLPIVAGKPEVAIFEEAFRRFGSRRALMIGDRLDTDILGANRAGIRSALVLTGIDRAKQVLAAVPDQRPTYLFEDLRQLHEPYPDVLSLDDGSDVVTVVGDARVRRSANRLLVESGSGIDLLRAGAAAIWNSGMAIYGLDVPAALYE
ncbi:HAD-IIA family hydrolase [Salinibacterium soli]|uniref:HAD-IIA family hydrolase n=1 Tax=Antiquaquibacter soli TaxID=3064523 RepID=A0ABT9BL85_9MICO|nr:HAD-IIA family hydrolase [Protaetiibacter sp. WY-16]MDO7881759.1 HAD-IIA family hydrolase [Protaetiibacter sp. WY-16]